MKIQFEMGHPTDINLFKNLIGELEKRGHTVNIAARDRDETIALLEANGLDYDEDIGKYYRGMINKAFGYFKIIFWLTKISKRFKPDVFISPGTPYSALVSKLLRKPHIAFSDTETANLAIWLMRPFTDVICTSTSFKKELGSKQYKFNSYYELAYLHPQYFKPDPSILKVLDIQESYIVLRFSLLESHHDIGVQGFNFQDSQEILEFIETLEEYGRVIITSEKILEGKLEKYRIKVPPHKYLDFIAYSLMYIGEGAKTASEAAVLGVPSIYVSTSRRGYIDDIEDKYGLIFRARNREQALKKAVELLEEKNLKMKWQKKRDKLLKEKIDTTMYMADVIEKYVTKANV